MFELYGNTLANIISAIVILLGIIGAGVLIRTVVIGHIARVAKKTDNRIDDLILFVLRSLKVRFYTVLAILAALSFAISLPDTYETIIKGAFVIFIGFEVIRVLFRVTDFLVTEYIKKLGDAQETIATVIPALSVLAKSIVAVIISTFVLSNLGINVTTLLAGLGIGGVAVAFALQKILADLFSTFVIFFDKPFSAGDFITSGGISGTVERVGIKTTHIRSVTGEKIIVPNQSLVDSQVLNTADLSERRVTLRIPIAYNTNREKLADIPETIEDIILSRDKTKVKSITITEFDKHAIIFEVIYWVIGVTYDEHTAVRHDIYLDILKEMDTNGITLGYPIAIHPDLAG